MTTAHALVKGRDWHPAPPWYGYCDSCTDVDGAPVGWTGNTEAEIDDWFYEHTIQDDAR